MTRIPLCTPPRAFLAIGVALLAAPQIQAAIRSWDSGGTNGLWGSGINWTGNVLPGSVDDVKIGDLVGVAGEPTTVNQNFTIQSLALSNGVDVDTGGFELIVNGGPTTLVGNGTRVFVSPNANPAVDALDVDSLSVGSGAVVNLEGGILEVDAGTLTLLAGSLLTGRGRIDLKVGGGVALANDGMINVRPDSLNS